MSDTVSDEIDLLELLEILWQAKWGVGAISALAGLGAWIFLTISPPNYIGELQISALDNSQIAAYATLNDTPGISRPIYSGEAIIGQEGVILSENLFQAVLDEIARGRVFRDAHEKVDPAFLEFIGSDRDFKEALNKKAKSYEYTADNKTGRSGKISFETSDRQNAEHILKTAFARLTEKIRRDNLAAVGGLQKSIETSLAFSIEEVETAMSNAHKKYQIDVSKRLAILREQAAIARELNISVPAKPTIDYQITIGEDWENRQTLYLRGYKALEKEIKLIENRGSGNKLIPFIEGYPELAAQLALLQSDKRLERIASGIAASPLADADSFQPANVIFESIVYEPTIDKKIIVILITFLAAIFASLSALIHHSIMQRHQEG